MDEKKGKLGDKVVKINQDKANQVLINYADGLALYAIIQGVSVETLTREMFDKFYQATAYLKTFETEYNAKLEYLMSNGYKIKLSQMGNFEGLAKHPKREEILAKILELKMAKMIPVNFETLKFIESESEFYDMVISGAKLNIGQINLIKPYLLK